MMTPDFKATIVEVLTGATADNSRGLSELIGYIDSRDKSMVNYDELREVLKHLVESGKVQQVADRYCAASSSNPNSASFAGFGDEAYRKAEKEYGHRFWKTCNELSRREQ
jgi:hypothetical protein